MNKNISELTPYLVMIYTKTDAELYPRFATDHHDALDKVLKEYLDTVGPLPPQARVLVQGPCRSCDPDCGGKTRFIIFDSLPVSKTLN